MVGEMEVTSALGLVRGARVARLGTIDADGGVHLVPIVFALRGATLYSAVDHKPKRSLQLQRIRNARERPVATVLIDHYAEDWGELWWVRLRGTARVLERCVESERAIDLLVDKYEQYAARRPQPPVLAVDVGDASVWQAFSGSIADVRRS